MSERAEFHVMGQPFDGKPLHYTASGLNYVYLQNGYTIEDDPDYGRIVSIQDADELHRAIGLCVVTKRRPLTGAEFKFLRKEMNYKQKELAEELGVNEQTVANYEKGKPIPRTSDRLMRAIFLLWVTPEDAGADLLKAFYEKSRGRSKPIAKMACPRCAAPDFVKNWQGGPVIPRKASDIVLAHV